MKRFPLIEAVDDIQAVILADGIFPSGERPLRLLTKVPFVCACDGAAIHYPQADIIVGDGDSIPATLKYRLIKIDEQDDNDLTKATRYCLSKGFRRLAYIGATGGREDHTIGNISLIVRYAMEMGIEPLMATEDGWFVVADGSASFASFKGQQVSIFNVNCQELVSKGLRWQAYPYRQLWQGTLNEATGESFSLKTDGYYLVYRTYLPKVSTSETSYSQI